MGFVDVSEVKGWIEIVEGNLALSNWCHCVRWRYLAARFSILLPVSVTRESAASAAKITPLRPFRFLPKYVCPSIRRETKAGKVR